MDTRIRPSILLIVLLLAAWICDVSARPGTDATSSDIPTTQKPSNTSVKKKLEQLKKMEENALIKWYDMVNNFLVLIKPDDKILEVLIDHWKGTIQIVLPSSIFEIAKENSTFLAMISLGVIYVIVMLLAGIFFFCCRVCGGRCGAKETQKQTRNINCWRTTHKFCLVLMIAFLVVPITCMCIINEHMKQSFPSVKSNASEIFPALSGFANKTEEEINNLANDQLGAFLSNLQDPEKFKKGFAIPLQEDIFNSVSSDNLEFIKSITSWILAVKEKFTSVANDTSLTMALQDLKSIIRNITDETEKLKKDCSGRNQDMCDIVIQQLSVKALDVDSVHVEVEKVLQKILNFDSDDLKNVIEQIQNNTILANIIAAKSDNLRKFENDFAPKQNDIRQQIKTSTKTVANWVREMSREGQHGVDIALTKVDQYEDYRYWIMLGIAIILVVPVAFLVLGLVCGCCGYEKGRHPSKRSSLSNSGGVCLILAVYYFFLISSLLMLLTILLFFVGGLAQTFICLPLYQENFEVLDQVKTKLESFYPDLKSIVPSKALNVCRSEGSIFEAIDVMEILDHNGDRFIEQEFESVLKNDDTESSLRNVVSQETSKIRRHLSQFSSALNLTETNDLMQLQVSLRDLKQNIEDVKEKVTQALAENPSPDINSDLQILNESAILLLKKVNDFEKLLNNFSSILNNTYTEAYNYKEKISLIEVDLDRVEKKIPDFVHNRLLQYLIAAVDTDMFDELKNIGKCESVWLAFDMGRTVVCDFVVYPINGFWFGLGWILFFIIPTIIFAVKLSRHYIRMMYDDDLYLHDSREAIPLEEMNRTKPFSYTNPGNMSWMPQFGQSHNYMVHPTSSNHVRQFDYK